MAKRREKGWYTIEEAAVFVGKSQQSLRQTILPRLTEGTEVRDGPGKTRSKIKYVLGSAVVEHYRQLAVERAIAASAGRAATSKERYDLARALIAEYKLEILRGKYVPRLLTRQVWQRFCTRLRKGGEALTRAFGQDAQEMFSDALHKAETDAMRFIDKAAKSADE